MRCLWIIALALLASAPRAAFAKICGEPTDKLKNEDQLSCLLEDLVENSFPNLSGKKIEFVEFKSTVQYFKSSIRISTIRKNPGARSYVLHLNPRIYRGDLNLLTVQAAMAHELVHLEDFSKMGKSELTFFLSRYKGDFKHKYERLADLQTLSLGFAPGLKAWRGWTTSRMPASVGHKKKSHFLTVEEIESWENGTLFQAPATPVAEAPVAKAATVAAPQQRLPSSVPPAVSGPAPGAAPAAVPSKK